MRKLIVIAISAIILSGCAPSRIEALNSVSGLEYGSGDFGAEVIESYTANRDITVSSEKLALCVASSIDNGAIQLKDSSGSFVGAYSDNYYNIEKSNTISGGPTIQHASQGGVVANGVTSYSSMAIKYYVKYTLRVQQTESGLRYIFSNIQQAQGNTGSIPNSGFSKINTDKWSASGAESVIKLLDGELYKVQSCLEYN